MVMVVMPMVAVIMFCVIMARMAVACMIMGVTVMRMIVMIVRGMGHRFGFGIGAAFRVKGRFDWQQPSTEAHQHFINHPIRTDAQSPRHDLHGQMAIANVPGEAGQRQRRLRPNLRQGFGAGDHFHSAAILQYQGIAMAKRHHLRPVEQKVGSSAGRHANTAAVAAFKIEQNAVVGGPGPGTGGFDPQGARHICLVGGLVHFYPISAGRAWPECVAGCGDAC